MAVTAKQLYSRWFFFALLLLVPAMLGAKPTPSAIITITTSPNSPFYTTLEVREPVAFARRILKSRATTSTLQPDLPRAVITINNRRFVFDSYSHLFEPTRQTKLDLSPTLLQQVEKWVVYAEKAHFGKPLEWNKVKDEFARMDFAIVTDLETGESFRIQRRAGNRHADVQPLTREDTATMKRVYGGKWSWKRRAILVSINGQTYAASMHGMPHGAGAIVGNNFPGHFCIHFRDSSTHRSLKPDPSHNLMIVKASGNLQQTLLRANPTQVVDIFLLSLHEQDHSTLSMTTDGFSLPFQPDEVEEIKRLHEDWQNQNPDLHTVDIAVDLTYYWRGQREEKGRWIFHLERTSPLSRWKITTIVMDGKTRGGEQQDDLE